MNAGLSLLSLGFGIATCNLLTISPIFLLFIFTSTLCASSLSHASVFTCITPSSVTVLIGTTDTPVTKIYPVICCWVVLLFNWQKSLYTELDRMSCVLECLILINKKIILISKKKSKFIYPGNGKFTEHSPLDLLGVWSFSINGLQQELSFLPTIIIKHLKQCLLFFWQIINTNNVNLIQTNYDRFIGEQWLYILE